MMMMVMMITGDGPVLPQRARQTAVESTICGRRRRRRRQLSRGRPGRPAGRPRTCGSCAEPWPRLAKAVPHDRSAVRGASVSSSVLRQRRSRLRRVPAAAHPGRHYRRRYIKSNRIKFK